MDKEISQSRRGFVGGMLAAGFALAVPPVEAQVIKTSDAGLLAGEVMIPTKNGDIPAYRARPQGTGPVPTVLVVQEIFGVHEYIRDVCRRLALQGYMAIAPQMFHRQADVSQMKNVQDILSGVVSKVADEQVLSDLDAALAWAAKNGGDPARSAITGFCWGGRITWLYAARNPKLKAAVAWYGRLDGAINDLQPKYPLDVAAQVTVPVLGLYAGADQNIPVTDVEHMQSLLAKGKSGSAIQLYPDVPHAFHADYRPTYRKEAAEDGWKRLTAWFKEKL